MAIEKRFIHFKKFSDFNSKKLSANEANTQYTVGISGEIQTGSPDVLYQSYVWIKDTQQQWTHGQIYNGSDVDIDTSQYVSWDDVANVAKTGSYNDLQDKPTIPSAVTESTVSGWGFTKNTGTYSKPSTGIPKSDLNSSVQTSLGKADTAVQPSDIEDEVYIADFTIESLKRGWRYGTQVDCDMQALAAAMNANKIILVRESENSDYKGVHILNGYVEDLLYFSIVDTMGEILWCEGTEYIDGTASIDGTSLHLQLWEDKQDVLVSGDNIKTINGNSIMGSGNIEIGGGGTITEIKVNGTSIATSGIANIPAASTSVYGVTKLTSSTSSTSTTLAATASAVKAAYDLADSYKGTVTSVKINDITKTPTSGVVDLGKVLTEYTPMSVITASDTSNLRLYPNRKLTHIGEIVGTATFTLFLSENDSIDNSWNLSFKTGATAPTINFGFNTTGYTIIWANGVAPTFEANTYYEISFRLSGTYFLGVCGIFKDA